MKKIILFFIVLLLAVGLGVTVHKYPAYVLVSLGHVSIQTSLWFAIMTCIVGYFLIGQFIGIVRGIFHIPSYLQHTLAKRKTKKTTALTQKALCAFLEERWDYCETYFYETAKKQANPFFYYMAAAYAAFAQKKYGPAHNYLKKAQDVAKSAEVLAVEIMRARWQLQVGNYQEALTLLLLLQKISPKHPIVLVGLKDAYVALKRWQLLYELLPQLRRHTKLDVHVLDELEQLTRGELLIQIAQTSALALENAWRETPKKWRQNSYLLNIYINHLITQNQHAQAEKILIQTLKDHRDPALLQQYAALNSKDSVKQLARAEAWLKEDPHNADLLSCLGNLCVRNRLWGKAKTYLEASLKYKPQQPEVYPILRNVLERLGI